MLILILILLVTFISLTVILWAGTFFIQDYVYTQANPGIFWQAPAAGLFLTLGYTVWCMAIALSTGASTINIPINAIHRFTPTEDMLDRPAARLWAIKKNPQKDSTEKEAPPIAYVNKRDDRTHFHYEDANVGRKMWQGQDVIAIVIEIDDKANKDQTKKIRFDLVDSGVDDYRLFRGADGWTIREYRDTGPTGLPERFRVGRLVLNLLFNLAHLLGWFVALWLVLRFQWTHALGLAVVMWVLVTLTFLPTLLFYAGETAESRQVRTAAVSPHFSDAAT